MTLAKTLTKIMPTNGQIGVHLLLQDDNHPITGGVVTVIDRDFTEFFSAGDGMVNEIRDAVGKKMQKAIDDYVRDKKLCKAAAYATAITQIDNNLNITE